jgi:CBS domain-containing protein
MKARDVMTSPVVTVRPTATVKDTAKLFLKHGISAAPVVDDDGKLVGIVSEGDFLHRAEIGTERKRSWWLVLLAQEKGLAADYIKAHAKRISDLMTRRVITASPEMPLDEIAALMEQSGIKRIPLVRDGRLVGIVSRANLVQAVASSGSKLDILISDTAIRDKLLAHLRSQSWAHTDLLNVTVNDGVVDLWGIQESETERTAIRVAAEGISGVRAVNDRMLVRRVTAEA